MTGARLGSTYRLQLHGLGFAAAAELVPYLAALGIETLYLSPVLTAAPGSTHGYDVVDPCRIDPALGGESEWRTLLDRCGAHGLRILLDIVPNHMSTDLANLWWRDVLLAGQDSAQAATFDIDWDRHGGRVLLPVLGRPLADVLEAGAATVDAGAGDIELDALRLPLAPGSASGPVAAVIARQHYRPASWRSAATMGNYRRFFDINGLVGVRVEDEDVFARTHDLVAGLCADPGVAGVRVDHVDGLADPAAYLRRLRDLVQATGPRAVLAEKILQHGEDLCPEWAVDGTTGYEFGDVVGGLSVDESGAKQLAEAGAAFTGEAGSFAQLAHEAKASVLEQSFAGDLDRVARLTLVALDETTPGHDLSHHDVRRALAALTVALDVYRTYLDDDAPTDADRDRLARTASAAGQGLRGEAARALELLAAGFTRVEDPDAAGSWLAAARRWQQLSGAVMAKGVEDTATYRYAGLLAQAEVGADPDHPSSAVEDFHRFAAQRPRGLNTTSTHDSKRNEDARARLAVLSEAPGEWQRLVARWHRRFAAGRRPTPHPSEEWAGYQSLLALWPPDRDRIDRDTLGRVQAYAEKAAREAKRRTSWDNPDEGYERVLRTHLRRVAQDDSFRAEIAGVLRRIAPAAVTTSLAMLVLKCTAPGTPDLYQGTELFAPTLTDPDNRRPVDFESRRRTLEALPAPGADAAADLLRHWPNGALKLFVAQALLHERRRHPDLFDAGRYRPLAASTDHVVAFARHHEHHALLCVVPRLVRTIAGAGRFPIGAVWDGATVSLPRWASGSYTDLFTGTTVDGAAGPLPLSALLGVLPVAVLRRTERRRPAR